MSKPDHPGVIAPPPLIYLGFLLAGFGIGRLVSEPSLGLDVDWRRGLAFVLVIGMWRQEHKNEEVRMKNEE